MNTTIASLVLAITALGCTTVDDADEDLDSDWEHIEEASDAKADSPQPRGTQTSVDAGAFVCKRNGATFRVSIEGSRASVSGSASCPTGIIPVSGELLLHTYSSGNQDYRGRNRAPSTDTFLTMYLTLFKPANYTSGRTATWTLNLRTACTEDGVDYKCRGRAALTW